MITRLLSRLLLLAALLAGPAVAAVADDFAIVVGKLADDSFSEKEKAIIALGRGGDPRAVAVLKALAADQLRSDVGSPGTELEFAL